MDYGDLIKRAWKITWRYKALWVLGIFAGVSGCQPGGGGNGGGGSSSSSGSSSDFGRRAADFFSGGEMALSRSWPTIVAALVILVMLAVVFAIVSVAARGGLIHAVDVAEKGNQPRLGDAWGAGWAKWGRLFLISLVLGLPVLVVFSGFALVALLPLIASSSSGGDMSPAAIAPLCGSLVIGLPLLLVVSLLVDLIRLLAERYAVIGDRDAFDAIKAAWGAIRARKKDTLLMYLLSGVLNAAASIVLAIPLVILIVATLVPVGFFAYQGQPDTGTVLLMAVGIGALFFVLISAFNAVWGTYTSALWTLFFRKLTDLPAPVTANLPVHEPMSPPTVPYSPPIAPESPAEPPYTAPPAPPVPPETGA